MDNLVFVCVSPHGPLLIPLVSGPAGAKAQASRTAMEELSRRMIAAQPETIVILETHSLVVDGAIPLVDSAWVLGELGAAHPGTPKPAHERHFALTFDVDRDLNAAIVTAAQAAGVPAIRVRHFLPETPLAIEWGSLVPLWFLGAPLTPAPKLVIACTNRHASQLPQTTYIAFGRALAAALATTERRVAVVISTDMAHTHAEGSRYGFSPAAAETDAAIVEAVRAGALERLLDFDQVWIDRAVNESIVPLLTLHGLLDGAGWHPEVLSYEAPTYYGFMCVAYSR